MSEKWSKLGEFKVKLCKFSYLGRSCNSIMREDNPNNFCHSCREFLRNQKKVAKPKLPVI